MLESLRDHFKLKRNTRGINYLNIHPMGLVQANYTRRMRTRRVCDRERRGLLSLIALLLIAQSTTIAQDIGIDICACQPSVYEFTLDFDLTCDDQNVGGPGISDTTCLTELRGEEDQDNADLRPVSVGQVSIFELDQNLDVIAQTVNTGNFISGDTFRYTSIIATEPDMLNPDSLPRGIQLVFIGINELNQAVVNTFAILYDNDCGVFPLLREGQMAGWSIFTDLGDPPELLCPLAVAPSSAPTMFPAPTPLPTSFPTRPPNNFPTEPTTAAPVPGCAPQGKGKGKGKGKGVSDGKGKGKGLSAGKGKGKGAISTSSSGKGKGKGGYTMSVKSSSGKGKGKGGYAMSVKSSSGKGKGKGGGSTMSESGKGKGQTTRKRMNGKGGSSGSKGYPSESVDQRQHSGSNRSRAHKLQRNAGRVLKVGPRPTPAPTADCPEPEPFYSGKGKGKGKGTDKIYSGKGKGSGSSSSGKSGKSGKGKGTESSSSGKSGDSGSSGGKGKGKGTESSSSGKSGDSGSSGGKGKGKGTESSSSGKSGDSGSSGGKGKGKGTESSSSGKSGDSGSSSGKGKGSSDSSSGKGKGKGQTTPKIDEASYLYRGSDTRSLAFYAP